MTLYLLGDGQVVCLYLARRLEGMFLTR